MTPIKTMHWLHAILTFFTMGFWAPVWIILTLKNRSFNEKMASMAARSPNAQPSAMSPTPAAFDTYSAPAGPAPMTAPSKPAKKSHKALKIAWLIIGAFFALMLIAGFINKAYVSSLSPEEQAARTAQMEKDKAARDAEYQAKRDAEWAIEQEKNCENEGRHFARGKRHVEGLLKAPSTAEFNYSPPQQYLGDCKMLTIGTVDSQNGFGAMIRKNYKIITRYDKAADSYVVESLKM